MTARRPRTQIAKPRRLDRAFEDPDAVLALIRAGAPYKTQEAAHRHVGVERTGGWFRNFWALGGKVIFEGAEDHFRNPIFIEAAREAFGAEIIQPVAMMTNLNLPMEGLPPHLDLPFFRGAMNREFPAWMLAPMGYSGLFHDWAVPVASVVTWFYDGEGGEFEYWPDRLDQPSRTERPPYHNAGVLADNEYMHHRVGAVGATSDWVDHDAIPFGAKLHLEDERWIVRDGDVALSEWGFGAVRLSVLWKAYCFQTDSDRIAFEDRSADLKLGEAVEIFQADLAARGRPTPAPEDPFTDLEWKAALEDAYPGPALP